jgi:hypothetical protein
MSNPPNLESVRRIEREVLQELCNLPDAAPDRARSHALCSLAVHEWKIADHRVVFNALRRSAGRDPALLREQLPAEATRLGFPDLDWRMYFDKTDPSDSRKIEHLARELLEASGEDAGQQ